SSFALVRVIDFELIISAMMELELIDGLARLADAAIVFCWNQLSELRNDPFDKSAQCIVILSLLRLVHDSLSSLFLLLSSIAFLLTSLLLLRNHRFIWPFQERGESKKKAYSNLFSMLTHSLIHMFLASKTRCIFIDSLISLITFLTWNSQLELPVRVEQPREQIRRAERG
ncbi:hypothetical protein PENTCL1PPCAC_18683, partial [Pristionchus entomophagus]